MKAMKNSISTAVTIILAMSVLVIGSDHAMAKEKPRNSSTSRGSVRLSSKSQQPSAGNSVRRSGTRGISDGTSNTIMVGERSAAGVISPRDSASGLPTGIVARNLSSSRKGKRQR